MAEDRAGGGVLGGQVRVVGQVADAGEGTREDYEPGQEQPAEEGGEDVVQAGDLVEVEEHLHVAGLEGVLPLQPGGGSSLWGTAIDRPDGIVSRGG